MLSINKLRRKKDSLSGAKNQKYKGCYHTARPRPLFRIIGISQTELAYQLL